MGDTWPEGGRTPPRPGYYAEQAEQWLGKPVVGSAQRSHNAAQAQVYAILELAAATERRDGDG